MKTGSIWEDFEWPVMSAYCWRETSFGLVLSIPVGATTVRRYRPLARESARLFSEFADLEPTPDAILGFARRYGCLGYPLQREPNTGWRVDVDSFPPAGFAAAGLAALRGTESAIEPFECEAAHGDMVAWCWKSQIELMADFTGWLKGNASWPHSGTVLTPEAAEEAGTSFRGLQVNAILAATVAPRLTPTGEGRSFRFRFEPRSLLGAMWLQAAQSAAEGVKFRHCASCDRPIAIARTTGARTDAKFCSDACKSRSYRNRQARAIELRRKGWTAGQIAKELHTTTGTVRGWIK